eukprot:5136700-Amphidinium_carterae.1
MDECLRAIQTLLGIFVACAGLDCDGGCFMDTKVCDGESTHGPVGCLSDDASSTGTVVCVSCNMVQSEKNQRRDRVGMALHQVTRENVCLQQSVKNQRRDHMCMALHPITREDCPSRSVKKQKRDRTREAPLGNTEETWTWTLNLVVGAACVGCFAGFQLAVLAKGAVTDISSVYVWSLSRETRNQLVHALSGNGAQGPEDLALQVMSEGAVLDHHIPHIVAGLPLAKKNEHAYVLFGHVASRGRNSVSVATMQFPQTCRALLSYLCEKTDKAFTFHSIMVSRSSGRKWHTDAGSSNVTFLVTFGDNDDTLRVQRAVPPYDDIR